MTYNAENIKIHYAKHCDKGEMGLYSDEAKLDLALSVLAEVVGIEEAQRYYQSFKRSAVDSWKPGWQVTKEQILNWLEKLKKKLNPYHGQRTKKSS